MTLDKHSTTVWTPESFATAREVDGRFPRGDDTGTYPGHGELYRRRGGTVQGVANRGQMAIDYMVSSKTMGDRIAAFLVADMLGENRLGTRYVIWYRRIISLTNTPTRWRPYVNPVASRRGTASGDHTNHPHQSRFYDAPYVAPEGDTVPTLPPTTVPVPGHIAVVSLKALIAAAKADPDRAQGGTTPGSEDDVRTVETALCAAGMLDKEYSDDGAFGSSTVAAWAAWQRHLGYSGRDADGIPGATSLARLAKEYRFKAAA